jgi:hypothetical protein
MEPYRALLLRPLLFAAALAFGLPAAGGMSADAGTVMVTGANGANAVPYHLAGAGGSATATTTTPSDPSNAATATGGNGGSASNCVTGCVGEPGGSGGAAMSTATTSISSGAASAEATSDGGHGGAGGGGGAGTLPGPGGDGGGASSSAAASSATGSASAMASSAGGSAAHSVFSPPPAGRYDTGGGATAAASATSGATGAAAASAISTGGADGYYNGGANAATASASARNSDGAAITSASAPAITHDGSSEIALTNATVTSARSSSPTLVNITAGRAVSNAILTPSGPDIGVGAMSAGYGGSSSPVTYEATATFDFNTSATEALDLDLLSDNPAEIGFDSLDLQVVNEKTSKSLASLSFTSSSAAEKFFKMGQVSLGSVGAGSQSIEIEYMLGYNSGTSAVSGDGFGFTYDLVDPRSPRAIPEPSTWAMMLTGLTGLGLLGLRSRASKLVGRLDRYFSV